MAKKIIYEWTGEYGPPKKGEWYFMSLNLPAILCKSDDMFIPAWILRRVESEVDDG